MNLFTKHPQSVGESYIEHFKFAVQHGFLLVLAGIACIIHGIFPFLLEKTGSSMTKRFVDAMAAREAAKKS